MSCDQRENVDYGQACMRSLTTFDYLADGRRVGRLIPRPDIPVQPVLSWETFAPRKIGSAPSILDSGRLICVTSARIAIAHALVLAGVQPGQKVLVPAYHCIAMIEPILHLGAHAIFYSLRDDMSVDLGDISTKLDAETCALIAVNYFGFPQNLVAIQKFCSQRGIVFIEDCAHSLFGSYAGRALGTFGHFAVASLVQFSPLPDGGCLVIADPPRRNQRVPL